MTHDRLSDELMTEAEIAEHDKLVLNRNRYNIDKPIMKQICAYPMYNKDGNTKIVVLVNTDSPEIMQEAISRDWSHTSMVAMPPIVGELEYNNDTRLDALYVVLDKHRFITDIEATTNDRLYKWSKWMENVL